MDFLEYNEVLCERTGAMVPGRLRVTDRDVIYKFNKSGKPIQFAGADIELLNWQRLSGDWAIRIFLKNGELHRFGGFKESDHDKIARHFKQMFQKELTAMEMSIKGWNWGEAVFKGNSLRFEIEQKLAFDVPLGYVSQCTTGKNEVIMEFHQSEDAAVNLTEMRFHVPSTAENPDPTDAFQEQVMKKASVLTATGDVLAIFREVQCLTPRGRYDIGMYPTFINMHGKTFDFKITFQSILRLMLLPHRDGRQMFFTLGLDPPIKQGLTRYPYLILLFNMDDDEVDIELPISDEDLKSKYEDRLPKMMKGPAYEVISKLTRGLVNRKITTPGSFKGHSGTPAIACSYKAAAGYLYPLDRGFMYVHKPPIYVRFDEIKGVNFARSGGTTRTFDFEISIKSSLTHTFSSIEKEEYDCLYRFAKDRKIPISSKGGSEKGSKYDGGGNEADPYLERMKREGEERESDESDDDESTDDDYNPEQGGGSDVAEEFESNPETTDSEDDGGDGDKRKPKQEKKPKNQAKRNDGETKRAKKQKKKETGAPKRPMTAFFLWLNENRDSLKEEFPGISITDLTKKAGERWRELKDKSKWEKMNQQDKARYEAEMKEWKASGQPVSSHASPKKSAKKSAPVSSTTGGSGAGFKSKEYVSDSDSSDNGKSDSKPASKKKKPDPKPASDEGSMSEHSDEDEESTPASSDQSGSASD